MKRIITGFLLLMSFNLYAQKNSQLPQATGTGKGGSLTIVQSGVSKKILADSIISPAKRYADSLRAISSAGINTNAAAIQQRADSAINDAGYLAIRKNNQFVRQFLLPTGGGGTIDTSFLRRDINLNTSAITTKLNITDTANIRLRAVAGTNTTITGTYPNLTFNSTATGGGGTASGFDSGAYRSAATINDTTLALIRGNNTRDTIAFSLSGQKLNPIAGTNTTITGTYPNLTFNSSAGSTGWDLRGNTTNPLFDVFGTNNNTSLRFKTNNILRAILDSLGRFAIGGSGLSDGDVFEVKSGNARIQNRLKFADGSGFTIEDRLIRSYGSIDFFDMSQGQSAFSAAGTGFLAGPNVTSFTLIPNRAQFKKVASTVFLNLFAYDYAGGEDFKIITPDYSFAGNTAAVMCNLYLSVGKNTTTNVYGKMILGHDGTSSTNKILVGKTTDDGVNKFQIQGGLSISTIEYADNATALAAGLPVNSIYRTGDLLKIVH